MQKAINTLLLAMLLGSVVLWIGCAASVSAPKWYLNIPSDPDHLYAAATAKSRDLQFAMDKAKHQARVEIGNQLETKITGLFKQYREEVGDPENAEFIEQATSVSKSVVSEVISGATALKQEVKQKETTYEVYVLMQMPIGEANAALMSKVRANSNLYTRFRASQGFKDLEDEVQKYEEWKKEQGM